MSKEATIFERVRKVVIKRLGGNKDEITEKTRIVPELSCVENSMALADLAIGLEDEFGITLTTNETIHIKTINGLVGLVDRKLATLASAKTD